MDEEIFGFRATEKDKLLEVADNWVPDLPPSIAALQQLGFYVGKVDSTITKSGSHAGTTIQLTFANVTLWRINSSNQLVATTYKVKAATLASTADTAAGKLVAMAREGMSSRFLIMWELC